MPALLVAVALTVGTVPAPDGGTWTATADGGVFAHGAPFHGSAYGLTLQGPVFGIGGADDGYRLYAEDGGVFAFNAPFLGSAVGVMPAHHRIVGFEQGAGYTLIDNAGNRYDCHGECRVFAPLVVLPDRLCGRGGADDQQFIAAVHRLVPPGWWCFVAAATGCESQWNRLAANPSSSARGYGQFLATWWADRIPGDPFDPEWQARAFAVLLADGGTTHWNASRACWN